MICPLLRVNPYFTTGRNTGKTGALGVSLSLNSDTHASSPIDSRVMIIAVMQNNRKLKSGAQSEAHKSEVTKVIFRKFPTKKERGDVIALFPEVPGTNDPATCMSYMHVGQHGAASTSLATDTRLASPEEYAPLEAELQRIGYTLRIVTRFCRRDYETRKEAINL